jgi:hypothetical protein
MSVETQEQSTTDPKKQGPKPPFDEPKQAPPGHSKDMRQKPDYGEQSYRGFGRLKGRKALVTGADSGIGRAVALAFAREGADVLISYLNEHDDARETERLVREAGRKAVTVSGSIEDVRHCEELVRRTEKEFGGIDLLVNNAAFQMTHESIEELTPQEWEKTFRTNNPRDVLPHPGRATEYARGQHDNQHRFRASLPAQPDVVGVRQHQGRHRYVHQSALRARH